MPIYEFTCQKCKKDSEVLVRSSDWSGTPCPHCGSTKLSKKLSVFSAAAGAAETAGCPEAASCAMNAAGGCGCAGPHNH